jgi:hypothetical protein
MSRVVTNPPPKSRFQESGGNISQHRDLLQNAAFEKSIDWAFLQFQHQLCSEQGDLNVCASKYLRLQGAHEFVRVLRSLAESQVMDVTQAITNLNHKA